MRERIGRIGWGAVLLLPVLLAVVAQHGCSLKAYEEAPASVLVSPATLNGWVTNGYGTDALGYDKMVVLDVSASTGTGKPYATGHIPGAYHLDSATELMTSRSDGVGGTYSYAYGTWDAVNLVTVTTTLTELNTPSEVATSDMMNAVLRRTGIDRNTVVVIVGDTLINAGLAYFNFRYWGFARERLRVLDRTKQAYENAGYPLVTAVPTAPPPSAYTVCDLTQNTSLRATLSDMIQVARGEVPGAIAWDVRTADEYNGLAGKTAGPFSGRPGQMGAAAKKVAFEGHVNGAVNLNYADLLGGGGSTFLDPVFVTTMLQGKGITADIRTHAY